jgi:hypothetical protein
MSTVIDTDVALLVLGRLLIFLFKEDLLLSLDPFPTTEDVVDFGTGDRVTVLVMAARLWVPRVDQDQGWD